jgi:hypothetical protein
MREGMRWTAVLIFATAMAWVEAAVVYDLRTLVNRLEPYQANPLPEMGGLGDAEVVRELATLVMLAAVGWLAGHTWRSRLGYASLAFGCWDILYYGFLKLLTGWPRSLFDWDVLFLLPLPWWGPVLAPVLIALLMVVGGTCLALEETRDHPLPLGRGPTLLGLGGLLLALYVFMADAIALLPRGADAIRAALPRSFAWGLFLVALALMAAPVAHLVAGRGRHASRTLPLDPVRSAQDLAASLEKDV